MGVRHQYSIAQLATAAQLETAARRDRVATVERLVAARKRSDHDVLKLAESAYHFRAMWRAFEVLQAHRDEIPSAILEKIEGPL